MKQKVCTPAKVSYKCSSEDISIRNKQYTSLLIWSWQENKRETIHQMAKRLMWGRNYSWAKQLTGETTPGETTPGETTRAETSHGRNYSWEKQLTGETTPGETTPGETTQGETSHGRNYSWEKRLTGETTHGRNDSGRNDSREKRLTGEKIRYHTHHPKPCKQTFQNLRDSVVTWRNNDYTSSMVHVVL